MRTTTGERFAAKVIQKREAVQKSQLEEAILSIVKEHPFIVTLEHVFENDRRIYFFMSYVEGHDLKGHLEKQKLFNDSVVTFYGAQIAQAIGYLHSNSIIYRDLKLENVLLESSGYVKIADFGLSKILSNDKS